MKNIHNNSAPALLCRNIFLVLAFSFAVFAGSASGAVDPLAGENGARSLSLGNAFTAMVDDATAIFTNVSGFAEINKINLMSMYSNPISNASYTSLALAFPKFVGGTIGVGYRRSSLTNTVIGNETVDYVEQDISLGYARQVGKAFSLGGTARYVFRGTSTDVPGSAGLNGNGATIDFGLKAFPHKWSTFGLSVQGATGKIIYKDGTSDDFSMNTQIGSSFKLMGKSSLYEKNNQDLWLNLDINKIVDEQAFRLHSGIEWWPVSTFALRGGIEQTPDPRAPTQTLSNFSGGFGLRYGAINFDYAYRKKNDLAQTVRHYFSFCYIPQEETKALTLEVASAEAGPRTVSPLLFSDVPKDHWAKNPIEKLTAMGVLDYFPDGTFRPERPLSRAETVSLLIKAQEKDPPTHDESFQIFTDVLTSHWAADYIAEAYKKKITYGYPDKTFKPRNSTTRAEGITFVTRFDGLSLSLKEVLKAPYLDVPVRHWAIREILSAKDNHYLDYIKGKELFPKQSITRAELAEMLYQTSFTKLKLNDFVFEQSPSVEASPEAFTAPASFEGSVPAGE